MAMHNLHEAFIHELQDLYSAETQITKALPKMAEKATNPQLKKGFEEHLVQTQGQIERLEKVFDLMGEKVKSETCKAMKGIIDEGEEILKKNAEPDVQDAMLIAAAQKVEHYEISSYGTVANWADIMGHEGAKKLLHETLEEERATDEKLTQVARTINKKAQKAA